MHSALTLGYKFQLRHPCRLRDKINYGCIVTTQRSNRKAAYAFDTFHAGLIVRYWRQQKSDQVILAYRYLRFVHLVPVGKIASLGLRRRRIAETPLQLLCDAINVR